VYKREPPPTFHGRGRFRELGSDPSNRAGGI
jgi:hypothetical protein